MRKIILTVVLLGTVVGFAGKAGAADYPPTTAKTATSLDDAITVRGGALPRTGGDTNWPALAAFLTVGAGITLVGLSIGRAQP